MTGPEAPSPRPNGDHLDLDALADALAGERPDDAHLRTCPLCTERLGELQGAEVAVVASLATLPEPALPDGLAERLATALRAEPARTQPRERTQAPPRTQRAARTQPARRRAWLPAAAASVALVIAGLVAIPALRDGTGGGRAVTAGGAGDSAEDVPEASEPPAVSSDSGVDYSDETARAAVLPDVLAGTVDGRRPTAGDPLAPLRQPARLEACLSSLLPPEDPALRPLAVDYARYGGTSALAVILPDTDPGKVSLYVVGPGCSAADSALLLFARLDRP